jgi:hypothetical protein
MKGKSFSKGFGFGSSGTEAGGGSITNPITATVAVGGVSIGENFPAGTTIETILDDLLAPYVIPSMSGLAVVFTPNDTSFEVGRTVTIVSSSWTVVNDSEGNPPINMYLTGDAFNKTVTGTTTTGAGTTQLVAAGSKAWSLAGQDKNSNPLTPSAYSKAWRFRYWLGATNAADPVGDVTATALALALQQSQLLASKTASFTCTADNDTAGNYTWIAYPASFGALTSIIQNGALPVLTAFTYIGSWNVTNAYGVIESYRFYKSNADKAFASGTTLAIS